MAYLVKKRLMHKSDFEEECKGDKEIMISNDACTEDEIVYEKIFHSRRRAAQDSDLSGIKSLLKELFPNTHLDLDNLTRMIISQCTCIVLKQKSREDEDADEINDPIDVYIISTVIRIKKNDNWILQLRDHFMTLANEYAPDSTKAEIMHILEDDAIQLEFLINERNIAIPVEMAISAFCLFEKMQQNRSERCLLKSNYFIYICKIFKTKVKYKKELNDNEILEKEKILWINREEKVIAKKATYSFEFSVDSELVNGLPGKSWVDGPNYWDPDFHYDVVPYRRVLIVKFSKLQKIIKNMKNKFNYHD